METRKTTLRSTLSFTLIELLVVIAIIALLASMLLPALVKARDMGRRIKCMGHLRNLGLAIHMYGNDWGYWPHYMGVGEHAWYHETKVILGYGKNQSSAGTIFDCPTHKAVGLPATDYGFNGEIAHRKFDWYPNNNQSKLMILTDNSDESNGYSFTRPGAYYSGIVYAHNGGANVLHAEWFKEPVPYDAYRMEVN